MRTSLAVNKFLSPWASFTNVYFRLASLGNTENTATLPRGQFLIVLCNLPVLLLFQGHQYRCHITRHLFDQQVIMGSLFPGIIPLQLMGVFLGQIRK